MLRSLPVAHPEELVQAHDADGNRRRSRIRSGSRFATIRRIFNGAFAYSTMRFNLVTSGEVRYAAGNLVSGDYFRTLGVQPALGRLLSVADDQRGCPSIAVLSDAYWRSAYGGRTERARENDLAQHAPVSNRRRCAVGIRRTRGRSRARRCSRRSAPSLYSAGQTPFSINAAPGGSR